MGLFLSLIADLDDRCLLVSSKLPFPDKVIQRIVENRVHAFSHRLVMDAVDVSGALNRHLLLYGVFT